MTKFYNGIVRKGSKIIEDETSGLKSVIQDIMKKHIELHGLRNGSTKNFIKMQVKEFKEKDKVKIGSLTFEIILKDY